MTKIQPTKTELIPVTDLQAQGFTLMPDTDPRRFGYPQHMDIFEVLWFEVKKAAKSLSNPVTVKG